jgi:hypothetical protein
MRFNVYDLLTLVRRRPAMYLGEASLVRMHAFLDGCLFMAHEFAIEREGPDFGAFHEWLARRFDWPESTAGWCGILLVECGGDDRAALERFFALVEEFRQEQA